MPTVLNIIISFIFLLLFLPFFILIILIILFYSGFPIFYYQERIGFKNKKFLLIKFRTMGINNTEHATSNITNVGKFLRKYSLDEIPNFINVLKGDMNIVGPRPLLVEYLELYTEDQLKRHDVKPGITGLAQVNGRNKIDWNEKFNYDLDYVTNRSFLLDIKIIFKTFKMVFKNNNNDFNKKIIAKKFKG